MPLSENFTAPEKEGYVKTPKGWLKKVVPFFGERTDPEITLQQEREFVPSYGTSPMKPKNPIQWSKEEY